MVVSIIIREFRMMVLRKKKGRKNNILYVWYSKFRNCFFVLLMLLFDVCKRGCILNFVENVMKL